MNFDVKARHLEVFLAVAKAGSMQRAAREIHLSQPAISKTIVELERVFAAPLLQRSSRGVEPTECGRALVRRAQRMLNDLDSTREEIEAIARGAVGRLRVGVLPVAEARLLSTTLLTLRRIASGIRIQVEEGTREVMLNALRRGEIDCVIGRLDAGADEHDLCVEKLLQLPIAIVVNPSHPLAKRRRTAWADLLPYGWVLPPNGAPVRSVIDCQFTSLGLNAPLSAIESTSFRLIQAVVSKTDLVGVITHEASLDASRTGELAVLPLKLTVPLPYIGVITRPGAESNALTTFLQVLRKESKAAF